MNGPTHASFFSGAGGLDLGLERAGWRTVSFSEIDPYASAALAQRWPGVPNLGDITELARLGRLQPTGHGGYGAVAQDRVGYRPTDGADGIPSATLWSGGFPCQDLSVAGKRRGLAGSRSGLAFSFLDLVGRHRPRFVLLENVPGLLSSHGGKDFGTLLATLVELGYGVGYRVLDARYFGVPQRRRRVFILGDSTGGRVGAERAAEVLSVGSRCRRHPPAGIKAGPGVAAGARPGVDIARAVTGTSGKRHDDDTDTLIANGLRASDGHHGHGSPRGDGGDNLIAASGTGAGWWNRDDTATGTLRADPGGTPSHVVIRSSPDSRGVRAPDGLAGRSHDRDGLDIGAYNQRDRIYANLAPTLDSHAHSAGDAPLAFTKSHNVDGDGNPETWVSGREARSMNSFDGNRTTLVLGDSQPDDPLLPLGLDSHRYRCCGNGVVADVGEWIGQRLLQAIERTEQ